MFHVPPNHLHSACRQRRRRSFDSVCSRDTYLTLAKSMCSMSATVMPSSTAFHKRCSDRNHVFLGDPLISGALGLVVYDCPQQRDREEARWRTSTSALLPYQYTYCDCIVPTCKYLGRCGGGQNRHLPQKQLIRSFVDFTSRRDLTYA